MDPIKILKRAWYILWSYRALWVFGLILALAGGAAQGHSSSSSSSSSQGDPNFHGSENFNGEGLTFNEAIQEMKNMFEQGLTEAGIAREDLLTLLWIGVAFILFNLILGLIIAIARYVSETAVIRMVDEYENTGTKMTVREGFRIGWSRTSWRLFLINFLVNLPAILMMILFIALGVAALVMFSNGNYEPAVAMIFISVISAFAIIFVVVILSILLNFLKNFIWRASVLEDLGVRDSFRRGFQMARDHWKDAGIMWLVMIGLGIVWAVVSMIAFVILLPVVLVTAVAGALVAIIPALLVTGVTSFVLDGWLVWAVGAIFALPLFVMIAFLPWLLLGSWQTVFTSTVWTLVYRELKALPALAGEDKPVLPAAS
jgi:hypothetical protein